MTPEEEYKNIRNTLDRIKDRLDTTTENIARHEVAIRDLVVVSRTVLTSIQEIKDVQVKDREDWKAMMKDLHERQAATDEKLNILISTVDRIIRQRNGQN
jgi:septation ring formation regulator EzrA